MKNIVSRRAFLSRTKTVTTPTVKKDEGEDPFFKKYANSSMPFTSSLRTSSGLSPYAGPWTDIQIFHFLRRTTFGLTHDAINYLRAMSGAPDAVRAIMAVTQPTSLPLNVYGDEYPDTQGVPYGVSWVYYNSFDNLDSLLGYYRTEFSFKPWWMGLLINQPVDVLEKMTLFWSNHFGARTNEFNQPKPIWTHYYTIRNNALGNFRTLIKAITIDPHMLVVLNGNLSTAGAPDENYARELQELFTVGKGPDSKYTEDDVRQAAKVLTGWRRQLNSDGSFSTYFSDADHDNTDKQFSSFYNNTVIKANGQYETDALLDMILQTDEAAKYIVRCIYRWFVYYAIGDAEEQNIIAPLADILRNNNYEIAPVISALFNSEHFFDPLNIGCIIKSPIDLYAGFNREIGTAIPNDMALSYLYWRHFKLRCVDAGQNIADPLDISGWPAYRQEPVYYEAWINSTTIRARAQSLNYYANGGYQVEPYNLIYVKLDSINFCRQFSNPGDPNQLVADISQFLLPVAVSTDQLATMKTKLILNLEKDSYWTGAWVAYTSNTADPMAEQVVRQRLNALLDYVTSLAEYQLY